VTPAPPAPLRTVVIGVGNPYRGDDGAGPEVAARLRGSAPPAVQVLEYDGDPAGLLDLWEGADLAVVIDAVQSRDGTVGALHRVEVNAQTGMTFAPAVSSHGFGPGEAVLLGRALGRLPRRLVLYGVEGSRFSLGQRLSSGVEASIAALVDRIAAEVGGCT
jgi:hydrogenase maturation protease